MLNHLYYYYKCGLYTCYMVISASSPFLYTVLESLHETYSQALQRDDVKAIVVTGVSLQMVVKSKNVSNDMMCKVNYCNCWSRRKWQIFWWI